MALAGRARSTSRRRPYGEELDSGERSAGPIYQSFPSPSSHRPNGNGVSPHSSPGSVSLPSPAMTVLDQTAQQAAVQQAGQAVAQQQQPIQQQLPQQQPQPSVVTDPNSRSASAYVYQSPITPNQPSPPRVYDYNYGVPPSALSQESVQPWNGGSDYTSSSQEQMYSAYGYPSLDGGFGGYDPTSDLTNGLSASSTTPPSSVFAASGLPFRGLDYIRNYSNGGYSTDQDALWQSYDPTSFGYDPELTFGLADPSTLLQDNNVNLANGVAH